MPSDARGWQPLLHAVSTRRIVVHLQEKGSLAQRQDGAKALFAQRQLGRKCQGQGRSTERRQINWRACLSHADVKRPTRILLQITSGVLARELAFADAGRSQEDYKLLRPSVVQECSNLIEEVSTANERCMTPGRNGAPEGPRWTSGGSARWAHCACGTRG